MSFAFGISFSFRKSTTALPAVATDEQLIRESILQIIGVGRGERVMRPDFGCNVNNYVFEPNNEVLPIVMESEIRSALSIWEPRIIVSSVTCEQKETQIDVTIDYIVIASTTQQTIQVAL